VEQEVQLDGVWQKRVDDKALIAYTSNWQRRMTPARLRRVKEWTLNQSYYKGHHYVQFNDVSKSLSPLRRDDSQRNLVRITLAILKPALEAQINRLTRDRPRLHTIPESDDHDKINAARYSNRALEAVWERQSVDDKLRRALYGMKIYGNGWLKCRWDPSLGVQLPGEDAIKDGDIAITLPRSYDMWCEDGFDSIDDMIQLAEKRLVHQDIVRAKFPDIKFNQVSQASEEEGTDYRYQVMQGGQRSQRSTTDFVNVMEYYRRPDDNHPKGVYAIIINDQVAYRDDNVGIPTPGHYFPYVTFQDMIPDYTIWSESTMSQLRDPIKALERLGNPIPRLPVWKRIVGLRYLLQ